LVGLIKGDADISADTKIRIAKGVANGMSHLAAEGITHRDLAARNVLLTESLTPKISDFGLSRMGAKDASSTLHKTKSDVGPLKWMAPEAIRDKVYSEKTDVWSYGITLLELIDRRPPFAGMDALTAGTQVCYHGLRPTITTSDCPEILRSAFNWCIRTEPHERPAFKELSAFFRQRGYD